MAGTAFSPDIPPVPLGIEGTILTIVQGAPKFVTAAGSATQLIGKVVAASAVASLSITGIPATFSTLQIIVTGRCDAAAAVEDMLFRFNSDSGANYDAQNVQGNVAAANGVEHIGATSMSFGSFPGATAPATRASAAQLLIPNYTNTIWDKSVTGTAGVAFATGSGGNSSQTWFGVWRPAIPAAINSVTLFPALGNIVAGSFMSIYGLQ